MDATRFVLNISSWETVCERAVLADGPLRRMRGLLGRRSIEPGEGMLLRPAPALHTAFLRFPIDAVFLDGDLTVVSVVENMGPFRAASHRKATAVLELAAGEVARRGIELGNQFLVLREDPDIEASDRRPRTRGIQLRSALRDRRDRLSVTEAASRHDADAEAPPSVLIVSDDRRFRAVASALLERRGCEVETSSNAGDAPDDATGDGPDVVVLDPDRAVGPVRALASVRSSHPRAGLVVVGDEQSEVAGLAVRPKWGLFDDLVDAIYDARWRRSSHAVLVDGG
jgi:uncharacterized membrane protein (UPF0127 family)